MMNMIENFYRAEFEKRGFSLNPDCSKYCRIGSCWSLSDQIGEGAFWIYSQKDLFDIKIHDFFFYEDFLMEFELPECLSITHYESISGEELAPYRRLNAGCIKTFIGGGYPPYRALIHKNIPIRSIGIEIMPAYYEDYLKRQYPGENLRPRDAFSHVGQTMDFPEMVVLLNQVKNYRGDGIAAKLFYEGKVAESVSLIVERNKNSKPESRSSLHIQDIQRIETVTAYLNDHYAYDIPLERLAKIACMGMTKLKTSFKQFHGCTVTEYIQQRRIGQAEHLLSDTDFSIGQIAQTVGYSSASRFAELFRKFTGLLPGEFRKMAKREA